MNEAWAAIIAAIISVVGTLIATKFNEIGCLLKPTRKVSGIWEVKSSRVSDNTWMGDFQLKLRQTGERIRGEMDTVRVPQGQPRHTHKWSGKMVGCDYIAFECVCSDPGPFMVRSGLLHLHSSGREMSGYFVANSEEGSSDRTWVGLTEMHRRETE